MAGGSLRPRIISPRCCYCHLQNKNVNKSQFNCYQQDQPESEEDLINSSMLSSPGVSGDLGPGGIQLTTLSVPIASLLRRSSLALAQSQSSELTAPFGRRVRSTRIGLILTSGTDSWRRLYLQVGLSLLRLRAFSVR